MRFYFVVFCLVANFAFALPQVDFKNACVPLSQFSQSQKEVLWRSFLAGEQYGFGLTLAAIAWKESCAGVYKMNFQDPSAGNFHAYIPGVINRYPKLKQNGFTQNMVGAMLVEDDEFAAQIAITELEYWKKEHNGNWKNIVKSYNKGYSWQKNEQANLQAERYYQEVAWRVKQLEGYFKGGNVESLAQDSRKYTMKVVNNIQDKENTSKDKITSQNTQQSLKQEEKQSSYYDYYTYGEDNVKADFGFLPIYQRGNEFAAPYTPKKTIIKEFDLIEAY